MSGIAIKVENVNKVFRIFDRPRDRLKELFSLRRKKFHTDFHALKNVSFEVKKGEFLGVVGKNGAGKSTLLKILSRELTPTDGKVTINGKVSLLQLGVGFDPELTGMENARFASKLLGYSDDEIDDMMEEIIAFAEIGEFIHHPVKTYSSGMYSRLSFAVAINISPDILIADEVLSVGDMRFAQKCLRKMREFKEIGKTIIFVTHDIQSVKAFCDSVLWIKDGEVLMHGDARLVTTDYLNYMLYNKLPGEYDHVPALDEAKSDDVKESASDSSISQTTGTDRYAEVEWIDLAGFPCIGDGRSEIKRMAFVMAGSSESIRTLRGNEEVAVLLGIQVKDEILNPQIGVVIYNHQGIPAVHTNNDICESPMAKLSAGQRILAEFRLRLPSLSNGNYMFTVGLQSGEDICQLLNDVCEFSVSRGDIKGTQCGYVVVEYEEFSCVEE